MNCEFYNTCPKRDAKHCFTRDVRICDLREQWLRKRNRE
jgi:hypothetical protein